MAGNMVIREISVKDPYTGESYEMLLQISNEEVSLIVKGDKEDSGIEESICSMWCLINDIEKEGISHESIKDYEIKGLRYYDNLRLMRKKR